MFVVVEIQFDFDTLQNWTFDRTTPKPKFVAPPPRSLSLFVRCSERMSEAYKVNEETSESEGQTIESISTEAVTTSTNAHNKKRELVSTEGEPSSSPSIIGNSIVSVSASSEGTKEESNKKLRLESKEMTDICSIVELKDGDRIEVHWDVQAPSGEVS